MKKIAIFVEGQTEQIFVKKLLFQYYGKNLQVRTEKIRGKNRIMEIKAEISGYEYFFLIIDVCGEGQGLDKSRVLSDALDNYHNLVNKGFTKILGLRDLYPQKREDKAKVVEAIKKQLVGHKISLEILKIMLAIMEVEAWFLAVPSLFVFISSQLTPEYIREHLHYDLLRDDPEIAYNHPAKIIEEIYKQAGKLYRKREEESNQIANALDYGYLCLDVKEQSKIESFFLFLHELETI